MFDFFNFGGGPPGGQAGMSPEDNENMLLNTRCEKYLCPDTGICAKTPGNCPCPFPSSQLRCSLPNGRYVCISKPAGEGISNKYNDPKTNWKLDAKNNDIRDCGWVDRAYKGLV
ncbi:Long chronological lifespan protein 2 [Spathaspora sp. JA1]|nr:Long chronological lifespan protein 2 [Spathaspora sp. JA1]